MIGPSHSIRSAPHTVRPSRKGVNAAIRIRYRSPETSIYARSGQLGLMARILSWPAQDSALFQAANSVNCSGSAAISAVSLVTGRVITFGSSSSNSVVAISQMIFGSCRHFDGPTPPRSEGGHPPNEAHHRLMSRIRHKTVRFISVCSTGPIGFRDIRS